MREVPLVMPKMSMTMTEGTFLTWHRGVGDEVKSGDVVCEVASDKVDMEVESPVDGTLTSLVAEPDGVFEVGAPLAYLSTEADDMLEGLFDDAPAPADPPADPQPAEPGPSTNGAGPRAASPPSRKGPRPAVPYARRRASELGVDIEAVDPTGPDGVVTVADVESAASPAAADTPEPAPAVEADAVPGSAFGPVTVQPLGRVSRVAGPALTRSWTTIPHVTHHDDADITDLEPYRTELDAAAKQDGYRVTLLAFVLKAVASALHEYPTVNSSLTEDGRSLAVKQYVHLGVAVDTDGGLVVPVVRDVDRKGLLTLSRELGEVSARAREGGLTSDDVQGATFTVSSLGGIGGRGFTPIVNGSEAGILGVMRSRTEPVWDGEAFVPRLHLPLSFSYDHRIVDGALGARFLTRLCYLLGDVRRLVL